MVLRKNEHKVEVQKSVPITFLGKQIGVHVLDVVVDGRIILKLKAVSEIAPIHKQQALSYLKATGLPLALIINFGAHRLQVTRVVNTKQRENIA
ncbi:MAG: GxxExxY protein [Anaerolineales bacterium]|nr:GxxExxY protein [Anaerolineales bacterium]